MESWVPEVPVQESPDDQNEKAQHSLNFKTMNLTYPHQLGVK
jgi:hypothetical protein